MSTLTTNLDLVKPAGNERVDVDVINSNYDKIDQFAGLTITDADYVHTDNNYTTTEKNKLSAIQPNATATSFTQTLVSGTAVGTITINGTDYVIYAPSSSGGASALNDLTDVTLANPSNGQVLKYNATTGKWENADESGGGGGYMPTGESYRFFTDGSTAAANYTLYVQWTDGETVTTAVIVEYAQIISGWTTGDYQDVTINWDRNNACFNFVAKTGSFENGGNYYDEGETMGTLASGNITFNVVEKEATGVEWTQIQLSGTKIAEIEIDGVPQNVYAPTPPTKTSDLTNDSNFVADASYVHTDNNYTTTEKNKLSGLVGVEANPSGTASTDLTKIAIGGTNYNIPSGGSGSSTFAGLSDVDIDDTTLVNGQVPVWNSTTEKWENGAGGGGTTVVPNPQGTPTDELNTIQIGNDIYSLPEGGGGPGFSRTNLYTASTTETVVELSQSIEDFDAIELVSWYNYGGTVYTENAIYSALDMKNAIGTAKAFGIYNDAWFTYYRVNDVDELECVANNNSWYVQEIYGLKFGSGGGSSYTEVTGTLIAGQTSITLSDASITTNSTIEPFTNKFGLKPTNMIASTGSVTLTFPVQSENLNVKVRVS